MSKGARGAVYVTTRVSLIHEKARGRLSDKARDNKKARRALPFTSGFFVLVAA